MLTCLLSERMFYATGTPFDGTQPKKVCIRMYEVHSPDLKQYTKSMSSFLDLACKTIRREGAFVLAPICALQHFAFTLSRAHNTHTHIASRRIVPPDSTDFERRRRRRQLTNNNNDEEDEEESQVGEEGGRTGTAAAAKR